MAVGWWSWLAQEGPLARKHRQWPHPIVACGLHYLAALIVTTTAHDLLLLAWYYYHDGERFVPRRGSFVVATVWWSHHVSLSWCQHQRLPADPMQTRSAVAIFLVAYSGWLLGWRLYWIPPLPRPLQKKPRSAVPSPSSSSSSFGSSPSAIAAASTTATTMVVEAEWITAHRAWIWYEYGWLCNISLILGAWALATQRPVLAGACCVTVGLDQLLWYVDGAAWLLTGHFPVGVCRYLTWPDTFWYTRVTCTHHLWTLPLLLYATRGVHVLCWPLSAVLMTTLVSVSRWLVPLTSHLTLIHNSAPVTSPNQPNGGDMTTWRRQHDKYLNVNLSHELWKDIQSLGGPRWFLHFGHPSAPVYVMHLLLRWQVLNGVVWFVLRGLGHLGILPPGPGAGSPPIC